MTAPLYECDVEGCDWTNSDWRYGFAEAGANWANHMADHRREAIAADLDNEPTP